MSQTSIYSNTAPASWQQWFFSIGIGLAALSALNYHVFYLNHLRVSDWDWRYLMVNHSNGNFVQRLRRMKIVMSVLWLAAMAYGLYYARLRVLQRGKTLNRDSFKRMVLALLVFLCTVVNYDPPDIDLSLYFFMNSVGVAAFVLALYRIPYTRLALMVLGCLGIQLRRIPTMWLVGGVMVFTFFTAHAMGGVFFSHMPLTVDTSAQLVHAKMLAQGQWSMPSHPLRDFFNMYMMINDGSWYSQYPPGHVIFLAIGTYFKSRSYVNPLLGALTTLAVFGLARELYGLRVARLAVVMAGGCVYLLMMASEFMSNATSLLMATLFLWAYFRLLKKPHWITGVGGGMAIGYCFITRPYSTLALGLPYIIYSVYLITAQKRVFLRPFLAMALAAGCFVVFQLYYNAATTGNALTFGYELSWGQWHNPLTAEAASKLDNGELLKNLRENLQRTGWFNRLVFEWPIPTLIFLALIYGWRGGRRNEKLLFLTILSFFASCQVLPGNVEREWGPRLCYEILGIIIVMSAKALLLLPAFFRIMCRNRKSLSYYYGFAVVLACVFYGLGINHNLKSGVLANIYNFYHRGNNPGFYKSVMAQVEEPALVFVSWDAYQAVSFTNPPMENSPVVFATNLDKSNTKLMDYYPERNVYGATIFRNGFRVDRWRRAKHE